MIVEFVKIMIGCTIVAVGIWVWIGLLYLVLRILLWLIVFLYDLIKKVIQNLNKK